MKLEAVLLSAVFLTLFGGAALVPSANDQCKILYGPEALFCQEFKSTMCSQLACRLKATELYCNNITTIAASEGTKCGHNQVCIDGDCVDEDQEVSGRLLSGADECPFGDGLVLASALSLVDGLKDVVSGDQLSCPDLMAQLIKSKRPPFLFCANSYIRKTCCQTCQIYDKFACQDTPGVECSKSLHLCNDTRELINNLPVSIACGRSCGVCGEEKLRCSSQMCQNDAECVDLADDEPSRLKHLRFKCKCLPGYSGDFCELKDPCEPNLCKNNSTCVRISATDYKCICLRGLGGKNCEAVAMDWTVGGFGPCQNNPCMNGGFCSPSGSYGYTCTCPPMYQGQCCQSFVDPCSASPCPNNGVCSVNYNSWPYYQCAACVTTPAPTTPAPNPCFPNPCQNGGYCNPLGPNSYYCSCPPLYTGTCCTTYINPCYSNGRPVCQNNAYCSITNSWPFYKCTCLPGYLGTCCEVAPTTPAPPTTTTKCNACQPNPCLNNGVCYSNTYSSYTCLCPANYYGSNCQFTVNQNPCLPNPCLNGGTCVVTQTISNGCNYVCNCCGGWTGQFCQSRSMLANTIIKLLNLPEVPANHPYVSNLNHNNNMNLQNGPIGLGINLQNGPGINFNGNSFNNPFQAPQNQNLMPRVQQANPVQANSNSNCVDRDRQFCDWVKTRGLCEERYIVCPASCGKC